MSSVEYLRDYYDFDDSVMDAVERAAHGQQNLDWPEYARRYSLPGIQNYQPLGAHSSTEVMDIQPRDYDGVIVYHQPMACILDPNIQSHAATLAAAAPHKRVIAVGNPGQPGHGCGKLRIGEAWEVWHDNLRPTIESTLQYLHGEYIEAAAHVGESFGADKAAAAALHASSYDQRATDIVATEPTAVKNRWPFNAAKMGLAFAKTGSRGDYYLKRPRAVSQAFVSAEGLRISPRTYPLGLLRLSNLAIAHALGRDGFEKRMTGALQADRDTKASINWGTASEFDSDGERGDIVTRLQYQFGADRVGHIALEGHTHAMNLDIFLNAALILQSLQDSD